MLKKNTPPSTWLESDAFTQRNTHRSQSTAIMSVTSSAGRPTAVRTITMVTKPALGTPAAPILASVAVTLEKY